MNSKSGNTMKQVNDFKYLGSYIDSTERDMNIIIAKAWSVPNSMNVIWKSSLSRKLKINFFRAAVESVLLYGSTTWTQTAARQILMERTPKSHCHKYILERSHYKPTIIWKPPYMEVYKARAIIQTQRLHFAGHCWRNKKVFASDLLFWDPKHGKRQANNNLYCSISDRHWTKID